jgi:hypothetical protein
MTDLEIIDLAKVLLDIDIVINNNGTVVFYKNNIECVYTINQFVELYLGATS